ncbi:MAG: alanine racemase [Hyphomicrobiales bacterium]|nr:MAG: alanine racemase [Hyphomicrobiales bacterium]PCH81736.1 MAG: alanine racemase [Hyphomicrobiales bacterium]
MINSHEQFLFGASLTVDCQALRQNWLHLKKKSGSAECAAVVKANGYGLGLELVVPELWSAGCRTFFVAIPIEAQTVRQLAPQATVYLLGGLYQGAEAWLHNFAIRPVLGSVEELKSWSAYCQSQSLKLPAAIHFDTGMNRLGLLPKDTEIIEPLLNDFDCTLVISHLACADEPKPDFNQNQLKKFDRIAKFYPHRDASLANSAGVFLGTDYHFQMTRPGIAIYGGTALPGPTPLAPVVHLSSRVIQIRTAASGETVGYGGRQKVQRETRLAIIATGYADGYLRAGGCENGKAGALAYCAGHYIPVCGRISMDLIALDVTDVPDEKIDRGTLIELLGSHVKIDDLAARCGTIGYEILTNLGGRYNRNAINQSPNSQV